MLVVCVVVSVSVSVSASGVVCWLPLRGSWSLLSFVHADLNFSPRWHSEPSVEIILCQKHSRPFKKNTKTGKARCPHAISNSPSIFKNTTEVGREVRLCWRRCVGCCAVKKKCHVYDSSKKKRYL